MTAMLFFYNLQTITVKKIYFSEIYYHPTLQGSDETSVAFIPKLNACWTLLLLTAELKTGSVG